MSPKADVRAERIPQILQAARTVFARSGLGATKMEEIAQEAGLSKATIYLYFPSKEAVVAALLDHYFAEGFADLALPEGQPPPLRDHIGVWAERRIAALEAERVYLSIGYEFFALAARDERVRAVVRDYYRRYCAELTLLIAGAVARGEIATTAPPDLATALVGLFEGLVMLWMLEPTAVDLRAVTAQALDRLLAGSG